MENLSFRDACPIPCPRFGTRDAARLDQYYTRPDIAKVMYQIVLEHVDEASHLMVEPSAGEGAFSTLMPADSIAIDKAPAGLGIIRADFLKFSFPSDRHIAVVGNPPFGRNSSMAVRFFNHAATFASSISFILPRTFRKAPTENRLDRAFILVREELVPANAFLREGRPFHVPAVFQIWKRGGEFRALREVETKHPDFEFTGPESADFALQRVGARAGMVHDRLEMSPSSHHFLRARRYGVRAIMKRLDFASVAGDVAGNPSVSRSEIVRLYREFVEAST